MKRSCVALCAGLLIAVLAHAAESPFDAALRDTLKGDSRLTDPPALPEKKLGLEPDAEDSPGNKVCGPNLVSAPMTLGSRDQYAKLGGLVKSVGMGLLGKVLSEATGGGMQMGGGKGKEPPQPAMYEDPIPKKQKTAVKDKASGTDLRMGGIVARDGIQISTRLDDAEDKGTFHEIYLERDDCRRIYPFAEYTYELWGKWSLTVSWTKTQSSYQDGKLVDRQTSSGGFAKGGEGLLASGSGMLPLDVSLAKLSPELRGDITRYQASLQNEMGPPMWQRLGFGAPTSGARAVGTLFKLSESDLAAIESGRMAAVVAVTRERGPVYQAVGIPVKLGRAPAGQLSFAATGGK